MRDPPSPFIVLHRLPSPVYFAVMPLVTPPAIILHAFKYADTSKLGRLATREPGVQSAIAKGASRPKSRFGASLQVLSQGTAHLYFRPTAELQTLSAFDVPRVPPAALVGLWAMVTALGFAPTVTACVRDDRALDEGAVGFSVPDGGFLCGRCTRERTTTVLEAPDRQALEQLLEGSNELPAGWKLVGAFEQLFQSLAVGCFQDRGGALPGAAPAEESAVGHGKPYSSLVEGAVVPHARRPRRGKAQGRDHGPQPHEGGGGHPRHVKRRQRLELGRGPEIEMRRALRQDLKTGAESALGPRGPLGDGTLHAVAARREAHDLGGVRIPEGVENDGRGGDEGHVSKPSHFSPLKI